MTIFGIKMRNVFKKVQINMVSIGLVFLKWVLELKNIDEITGCVLTMSSQH